MKLTAIAKLIISILLCQLAGGIGALFTTPAIPTWYATLNKPSFTPPNWIFGPVWVTLYLLMAIAVFLLWRQGLNVPGVKTALLLFGLQLALNALWSPAFFGLKSPLAGAAVIIPLWIVLLVTIMVFFNMSRVAAILLIPYILWVSYAAALNISIMILNP